MRNFGLYPFIALLSVLIVTAPAASAQSANFTVSQHGIAVGKASFSFTATPSGYDSTALVIINMKGLDYSLSKTETLSPANRLRHVQLSAAVNGSAVDIIAAPETAPAQSQPAPTQPAQTPPAPLPTLLLNISANGHTTTTRLPLHSGAVFLPDFDPGALETLLTLAVARNNRNLWAIIPKKEGSVVPVLLATYADEKGTLDGKPVVVHHLLATIAGKETDLFSGPENQLLQAELPQLGFALIRNGFILTPSAKPSAPPSNPDLAPPAQQNPAPPAEQNPAPPVQQPPALPAIPAPAPTTDQPPAPQAQPAPAAPAQQPPAPPTDKSPQLPG